MMTRAVITASPSFRPPEVPAAQLPPPQPPPPPQDDPPPHDEPPPQDEEEEPQEEDEDEPHDEPPLLDPPSAHQLLPLALPPRRPARTPCELPLVALTMIRTTNPMTTTARMMPRTMAPPSFRVPRDDPPWAPRVLRAREMPRRLISQSRVEEVQSLGAG